MSCDVADGILRCPICPSESTNESSNASSYIVSFSTTTPQYMSESSPLVGESSPSSMLSPNCPFGEPSLRPCTRGKGDDGRWTRGGGSEAEVRTDAWRLVVANAGAIVPAHCAYRACVDDGEDGRDVRVEDRAIVDLPPLGDPDRSIVVRFSLGLC